MSKYNELIYEVEGKKAIITLNRPQSLNALSLNLKKELTAALEQADADKNVRVVILTGAGKAFCAGQELKETVETDGNEAATEAYDWVMKGFKSLYEAFRRQSKVTIAMINGAAAGSGLQIALLCDFRTLSSSARIGMTEIDVGYPLITGSGLLWNIVGPARTRELALTGRLVNADEANEWGLVSRVFAPEKLKEGTFEFADSLAEKAPAATASTKAYYRFLEGAHFHTSFDQAVIAHQIGYGSGEPQRYQKKFFEERAKRKALK